MDIGDAVDPVQMHDRLQYVFADHVLSSEQPTVLLSAMEGLRSAEPKVTPPIYLTRPRAPSANRVVTSLATRYGSGEEHM